MRIKRGDINLIENALCEDIEVSDRTLDGARLALSESAEPCGERVTNLGTVESVRKSRVRVIAVAAAFIVACLLCLALLSPLIFKGSMPGGDMSGDVGGEMNNSGAALPHEETFALGELTGREIASSEQYGSVRHFFKEGVKSAVLYCADSREVALVQTAEAEGVECTLYIVFEGINLVEAHSAGEPQEGATVNGFKMTLSAGEGRYCAEFSDRGVKYALFAEGCDRETFLKICADCVG